jgi:glycosyltransferase involved in cell wall biosynthesis
MKKISVIILTMNEEEMIADCIRSVSWSDDIYILDNGSTDRTVEIALQNQVQVVVNKNSDFSVLRNFGLTLAKHDWVLFLDADERVTPHLKKEIANIPESSIYAGYNILRKNFFFGYAWPDAEILTRLINRKSDAKWQEFIARQLMII